MLNSAIITPVLAAGATSPFYFQVNISQRLCTPTCVNQVPVFNPVYTLVGYSNVGTNAYVATINVQGVISYTPCNNNNCCCTKSQLVNQTFTIPFASSTTPTSVSLNAGVAVNSIAAQPCQNCSRSFVSETPIFLTVA